ncbi:MAG TPA: FCD domain-containing protein [Candidatus Dormibacteraeota bacterium]|nr:FCD domain-containing protein [Candidatus Dormibacteraeota bacterium]
MGRNYTRVRPAVAEAIAGTSGNSPLGDTLRRLRSHLRLYRLYHRYYTKEIGAATVIEHENILAAIRAMPVAPRRRCWNTSIAPGSARRERGTARPSV